LADYILALGVPFVIPCLRSFHTAERTIEGVEVLHVMRKGQVKRLDSRDSTGQAKFVASLFGIAA
jgi:transposase, IS6 family